jgi:NAD(P)-dependent dehydrogenase (short-subunit alcohol dehydrogenase family)
MKNKNFWIDKRILITGGTAGLGAALNQLLLGQGARTAPVARTRKGDNIEGDISDKRQIHRIYAEAISRLGRIDILFNDASSLGPRSLKLLLDTDCEDFENALQTNLLGAFRLTKLVVPQMILNNFGLVVNISSDAAINAYPKWGAYGISKAALDHMTQIFQAELLDTKVKFLSLDPGDMNTSLHLAAVPNAKVDSLHQPADSARLILEQIENQQFSPVRRSIR